LAVILRDGGPELSARIYYYCVFYSSLKMLTSVFETVVGAASPPPRLPRSFV